MTIRVATRSSKTRLPRRSDADSYFSCLPLLYSLDLRLSPFHLYLASYGPRSAKNRCRSRLAGAARFKQRPVENCVLALDNVEVVDAGHDVAVFRVLPMQFDA